MELRKRQEEREAQMLGPFAQLSSASQGREREEAPCDIRTDFQRDRDRILHSKSFRRLKHKTQVFISPEGDHYRTRLTHTLEVAQIARSIARALSLNEDLTEAIALGHDLGHTPFGHAGEDALRAVSPQGFAHNEQSLRIVRVLEKNGKGLNLTYEVQDGILNHRSRNVPKTMEGKVVRLSDKIAYLNHDLDDAFRAGLLQRKTLPQEFVAVFGTTFSKRIDTMIRDTIRNSIDRPDIRMSPEVEATFLALRQYMFEKVYDNEQAEAEHARARHVVTSLYTYHYDHPEALNAEFRELYETGVPLWQCVCDDIAGMTDRYAMTRFRRLFLPSSWEIY